MKKHIIFSCALLLASAITGEAMADCSTTPVTNLDTLLLGNTVCDATAKYDTCAKHPGPGCIVTMGIQEEHLAGSQLWDYKMGNTDPIDPRKQVGTWSVANNCSTDPSAPATVSYTYNVPGPAYKVYSTVDGNYDFCDGTTKVASVTIIPGTNIGCKDLTAKVTPPTCPGFAQGAQEAKEAKEAKETKGAKETKETKGAKETKEDKRGK